MKLKIKKLTETAVIPVKAHPTDSGFDLFADEVVVIEPGETAVVKTGIAIALPPNHEAQIRPKSGVTSKTDLRVQLGTVDEAYRGEIGVIVDNVFSYMKESNVNYVFDIKVETLHCCEEYAFGTYVIQKGDKIAQMVIAPVAYPQISVVEELDATDRGENGFGSTGV